MEVCSARCYRRRRGGVLLFAVFLLLFCGGVASSPTALQTGNQAAKNEETNFGQVFKQISHFAHGSDSNQSHDANPAAEERRNEDLRSDRYLYSYVKDMEKGRSQALSRVRRKATSDPNKLWPGGKVPYVVAGELKANASFMAVLREAMTHIEAITCVTFTERNRNQNSREDNYVKFLPGQTCQSPVGMQSVGEQTVSLSSGCAYVSKVLHELGHVLGLWHEHARADRDNNILLLGNNIGLDYHGNFDEVGGASRLLAPYDLSSAMHYDPSTFSSNGEPTFSSVDDDLNFLLGTQQELSFYDALTLNTLYDCSAECGREGAPKCQHGGFLSQTCVCVCPSGLSGNVCQNVITDSDCGGILDVKDSLKVMSPGYPSPYPNGALCRWLLRSAPDTRLMLNVTDLDIEISSRGTCRDRLEIRYHHIGVAKGPVYCGTEIHRTFQSMDNMLIITFSSNAVNRRRGFLADVKVIPAQNCWSNPCYHGATCYDVPAIGTYHCLCPDHWIGRHCELHIRDGLWSAWSAWSVCLSPCGQRSRERSCSDPQPANGGKPCEGDDHQTNQCDTDGTRCQAVFSCDFGTEDHYELCAMTTEREWAALTWHVHHGDTPSGTTGPTSGHTSGDSADAYLYLEATEGHPVDEAVMWLPPVDTAWPGSYCLTFYYHMRGTDVGSLAVLRRLTKWRQRAVLVWQRSGHQGDNWREASLDIVLHNNIQIGFVAVRNETFSSDIALDDVTISTGPCRPSNHGSMRKRYVCTWAGRQYRAGLFVVEGDSGCGGRTHCFCNTDGHVDCPSWQRQPEMPDCHSTVGLKLSASTSHRLGGVSNNEDISTLGLATTDSDQISYKDRWPFWIRLAHARMKARHGKPLGRNLT